jgi:hypothetical protein
MQGGDISSGVSSRYIWVFEGLVADLDGPAAAKHKLYLKTHAWKRAARCWTLDPWVRKKMDDLAYRLSMVIDIVTFLPEEEGDEIKAILDNLAYPFANFWATTQEDLMHNILPSPAVAGVVETNMTFRYGSKSIPLGAL